MDARLNNHPFKKALKDYHYLINRGYPERGVLKLVGDRHKLSGDLRAVLYRGISRDDKVVKRKSKLTDTLNHTIVMDGYNVLFTILNYRLGRIVFLSNDGICRDAGSLHGKTRNLYLFEDCVNKVLVFLRNRIRNLIVFLDAPVERSKDHQSYIQQKMRLLSLEGECRIEKSVDKVIRDFVSGQIASSDTGIIDNTGLSIADLPFLILTDTFRAKLTNLTAMLNNTAV